VIYLSQKDEAYIAMRNENICKFPLFSLSGELSVSCFVLETNKEIMSRETRLNKCRILLIETGNGRLDFNGESFVFSPGTLFFGFEGERFSIVEGEDISYFYVDFTGDRAKELFRRFRVSAANRKIQNLNSLIPLFKNTLLTTEQENIDVAAESLLLYVFSRLNAKASAQNDIIDKISEITEKRFHEPELSISDIAKEIGYNPKYLSHLFKKKMQVSYSEYLRSIRFKYSISLFELGLSSVKNVALLSGFTDPLYFSNAFKKEVGISPKEFIQRISQKNGNSEQ
jgi:AraC-like DNA-binding protein